MRYRGALRMILLALAGCTAALYSEPSTGVSFFPADSIFSYALTVTLSRNCAEEWCRSAVIVYTLDGSDPCASDEARVYERPFQIDRTVTVRAFLRAADATAPHMTSAAKTYIHVSPLPLPEVFPRESRIVFGGNITMRTPGFEDDTTVRLYYSLDGSDPSTAGTLYSGPFPLHKSCVVRAVAVSGAGEFLNSPIFYRSYTCYIARSPAPVMSPPSANYRGAITVSLSVPGFEDDEETVIYYTLDGKEPAIFDPVYGKPLVLTGTTEVKAMAVRRGFRPSRVTGEFYVNGPLPVLPRPRIVPEGGEFAGGIPPLIFESGVEKTMVLYTVDGTEPTMASRFWDGKPVHIQEPATVRVRLFKDDWVPSVAVAERYEFEALPAPVANREHGTVFPETLLVALAVPDFSHDPAVTIYYTVDGSNPLKAGTVYTEPFTLSRSAVVKAYARRKGYGDSFISTCEYFHLVRVRHAWFRDNDGDGNIETAIVCFTRRVPAPPSLIEFTDPFTGRKIRAAGADMVFDEKKQGACLVVSLRDPFSGGIGFLPGHFGRIPQPGEFDTAPFLVHDSTGAASRPHRNGAHRPPDYFTGAVGIINNPFAPGKTPLPEFVRQLYDFQASTGAVVTVNPPRPSGGYAEIFDSMGVQIIARKELVEDTLTGTLYLIWDGEDRTHRIVAPGVYRVVITEKEKQSGAVTRKKVTLTVKK